MTAVCIRGGDCSKKAILGKEGEASRPCTKGSTPLNPTFKLNHNLINRRLTAAFIMNRFQSFCDMASPLQVGLAEKIALVLVRDDLLSVPPVGRLEYKSPS